MSVTSSSFCDSSASVLPTRLLPLIPAGQRQVVGNTYFIFFALYVLRKRGS